MNRSTTPASGFATVISGTLQSGKNSPALYERSGLITISQAIDAYMAAYDGRDESRAQRMAWWQAKIGHLWEDIYLDRSEAAIHKTKNGDRKMLPLVPAVLQELELHKGPNSKLVLASSIRPDIAYHSD